MISQDHLEIYINIGEYDQEYAKYLEQTPGLPNPPKFDLPIRPASSHSQRPASSYSQRPGSGHNRTADARQPDRTSTPLSKTTASSSEQGTPATPSRTGGALKDIKDMIKNLKSGGKGKDKAGKSATDQPPLDDDMPGAGFLTMHSYGPWSVDNPSDLQNLCKVLIALSVYLSR